MRDALILALLGLGTFFAVVAAIGVVRLPDVYMRLSATTKASTLGASCLLAGVAVHFAEAGVTGKAAAIVVFLVLTGPVAAHMIGRAAYFSGEPLWKGSVRDELGASGAWARAGEEGGEGSSAACDRGPPERSRVP